MRRHTAPNLRTIGTWSAALAGVLVMGLFMVFVVSTTSKGDLTAEEVRILNQQNAEQLAAEAAAEEKAEAKTAARAEAEAKATAKAEAEGDAAAQAAITLAVERPADGPLQVLFAGDSLAAGLYATTEDDSFVPRVARGLGGKVRVLRSNPARGAVGKVVGRLDVAPDLDLAVVELGTNDVADSDPATFGASYAALLDKIRSGSPAVALLCVGVWYADDQGYDDIIRDTCEARGGEFVNLSSAARDDRNRGPEGVEVFLGTSDAFYPNDRGHREIAEAILEQVDVQRASP